MKLGDDNWELVSNTISSSHYQVNKAQPGPYQVRVASINPLGRRSLYTDPVPFEVFGKFLPPSDVQNFVYTLEEAGVLLQWDHILDLDRKGYELRAGDVWENGIPVSDIISTNSFIVPLAEFGIFDFMIRAVDTGDRVSNGITTLNVDITPADKIFGFTCVQVGSRLDFSWRKVNDKNLIGYEIREGTLWDQSSFVTFVITTRHSISYESLGGTRTFLIKAKNRPGIYSTTASLINTAIAEPRDNNKIFLQDEKTGDITDADKVITAGPSWAGTFVDVTLDGDRITTAFGVLSGEYITEVTLPENFTAQSTVVTQQETFVVDSDSWTTATWAWQDVDAERPWTLLFENSVGDVTVEIAVDSGLLGTDIDGWRYEDTTTSINGLTPTLINDVTFNATGAGRYSKGIDLVETSQLEYIPAVPTTFFTSYWIRPAAGSFESIRLEHSTNGDTLSISYLDNTKTFTLVDDLGQRVEVPYTVIPDTLHCIGIHQTSTTRTLFVSDITASNLSSKTETQSATSLGYNLLKVS
jgi:hypothetical protein